MTRGQVSEEPTRYRSLDGLRGIAALVVVFHHILLTSPALAEPYRTEGGGEGLARWMAYTPAHLLWLGVEPVLIFFVLSGFVLTLPVVAGRQGSWAGYYAKRLPRLYLPVWGAVAFATVIGVAVSRDDVSGASWWLNSHQPITVGGVLQDLLLLFQPGATNTALWSLQWEMWFSLALPLYVGAGVACARLAPRWGSLAAASALVLAVLAGYVVQSSVLRFMPVFGLGVLMAVERHRLAALGRRIGRSGWWALLVVALGFLLADWLIHGITAEPPGVVFAAGLSLRVAGAALLVFIFMHWSPAESLATTRTTQWLGSRSFSIYLVHEPIVVATGFLVFSAGGTLLVLAVALPTALLVGELFARYVEHPSHRAAQLSGRLAQATTTGR